MPRRFTIHPPYIVNRGKGQDLEQAKRSYDGMFSELHRYLRYITDANDYVQKALDELSASDDQTDIAFEVKIATAQATATRALLDQSKAGVLHSHPHVHGPEDLRLTHTEGVLPGQIFGD